MKVKVLSLAHPAAIIRGQWGREMFQIRFLKRLRRWAFDGEPCHPIDVTVAPATANLEPTADEVLEFLADPRCREQGVALDLELRCLGIMRIEDEEGICVFFERQGGVPYWVGGEEGRVLGALARFLADPSVPKVFHNGQAYDVPQLEARGYTVRGYCEGGFDTLLAHRYAYGESPADLQTMGIVYGGLTGWKRLVKGEEEGK